MSDLIEQLRVDAEFSRGETPEYSALFTQAADEIERLSGIITEAERLLPKVMATRTGELKGLDAVASVLERLDASND